MIDLCDIAESIVANRRKRGMPSAHDLGKTTHGLAEEVGEWAKSLRKGDRVEMIDALVDIMVYCLGGLSIIGCDPEDELLKVLAHNEIRDHDGHH